MINFNCAVVRDYRLVQRQLLRSITAHLPDGSWRASKRAYVEGCLNITLFVNLEAEVLMSHGAADKNYHWRRDPDGQYMNNVRHRTDVLVPGPFLRDRLVTEPLLRLDADHVHSVGWPRLDVLLEQQAAADVARPRDRPWRRRRLRVLWAPTHDRVRLANPISSYPHFEQHLDALRERFDVDVSVHPRNRDDKRPTRGGLVDADVVVADFGTTVYEAWALGKQVIFPSWIIGAGMRHSTPGSSERLLFDEGIGLHPQSVDEMVAMIETRAAPGPVFDAHMSRYLDPSWHGTSGRRVAEVLLRLDAERHASTRT